ncbi:reticulon-4 receptor-like 1b [Callorhinchus milii]|uniref:reticulon-4 receptor-like 1b n=1 Tax=Callorhinchus milii TaxID=7868 RepID=UPI001C3F6F2C|nr:reticulon-4 receptor-like 1b [Callorhinchus milii]
MTRKGCGIELFLVLIGLELHISASCPRDCVCYPSPMTVTCQSHGITSIPEGIPENSERIFLQNNRITLLLRNTFSPSTVTLWLYSNNITFIDPEAFRGFSLLEELDLGDNRYLRFLDAETFSGLEKLHALHLYRCGLTFLPNGIFTGLHNLQYLYLQENHIEYLQDDLFLELVNLTQLFLHGNRLLSLSQNTFRGLISLDRLLLHQNRLHWVNKRAFHDLRRLATLYLFNNSLISLPGECLAELGSLQYLRLNGNPWECTCKSRSLWDWLQRFRGSSSSVLCESPKELKGKDLKVLPPRVFQNCTGSELLNQIRTSPKQHPHHTGKQGLENGHRSHVGPPSSRDITPGHSLPGKNDTSHPGKFPDHIGKTYPTEANGARKKSANDIHQQLDGMRGRDYLPDVSQNAQGVPTFPPRRRTKCTRRPRIEPPGIKKSPSGGGNPSPCPSSGAVVLTVLATLILIIR